MRGRLAPNRLLDLVELFALTFFERVGPKPDIARSLSVPCSTGSVVLSASRGATRSRQRCAFDRRVPPIRGARRRPSLRCRNREFAQHDTFAHRPASPDLRRRRRWSARIRDPQERSSGPHRRWWNGGGQEVAFYKGVASTMKAGLLPRCFADRLERAGVEVTYMCHAGMIHHFYGWPMPSPMRVSQPRRSVPISGKLSRQLNRPAR